jgi:hypothetical protein
VQRLAGLLGRERRPIVREGLHDYAAALSLQAAG